MKKGKVEVGQAYTLKRALTYHPSSHPPTHPFLLCVSPPVGQALPGDTHRLTIAGFHRTPEMKAAAPCERVMAQAAKDATTAILAAGKRITVSGNSRDSFGRILGDVRVDGVSVSDTLLARGFARKYGVKVAWC